MTVAIVLRNKTESQLVHWAARISTARQCKLLIIWGQQRRGTAKTEHFHELTGVPDEILACCEDLLQNGFYFDGADETPEKSKEKTSENADQAIQLPFEVVSVHSELVQVDIEKELDEKNATCLVLPRDAQLRSKSPEAEFHNYLISKVPSEIILLTPGTREAGLCREIVTPVGEGPHSASCLRMANDLATAGKANLVALHVEPEIDEMAKQAAAQILTKAVDRALGVSKDLVEERVELANDVVDGIKQAISDDTDLIILGLKRSGLSKRFSSSGVAGKLVDAKPGPTIAVVQSAGTDRQPSRPKV